MTSDLRGRGTEEVLRDHLRQFRHGSIDEGLRCNYAEGVVFLTGSGRTRNSLISPVMAFFTLGGSLGNVPSATMLRTQNISFVGPLVSGADLVARAVIYLNAKYYGWRFALWLSGILYVSIVVAAVAVHYAFEALGAVPEAQPASVMEMMGFSVNTHTFWLAVVFGLVGLVLLGIWLRSRRTAS